jgi:hypothetical protein
MGRLWIGLLPNEHSNLIGLSKYSRLAGWIMSRPQIQEEAITQIADLLMNKVTPDVTKKLLAVRQSVARIRRKLIEEIQPIRLDMPTVTGPPGFNRTPWIERSQADIARARTAAQGEAVRRLNAFAEDCRLTTAKAAADGTFEFTRLLPGLYYVYAQASVRVTGERAHLQFKSAIWWASVRLTDGSAEIAFSENNALEWSALFPE